MDSSNLFHQEYDGDVDGKICSICKLELRSKQKILQCPFCGYLFHKDHLVEWLQTNKDCPVCNNLISIDISNSNFHDRITDKKSLTLLRTMRTFHNHHFSKRFSYHLSRILLFLLGLSFIGVSIYIFILVLNSGELQDDGIYIFGIFISGFVLIGFAMIIIPNLKVFRSSYNWKSLILIDDGILIEGKKLKAIKIEPNEIHSIELEQYLSSKLIRKRLLGGGFKITSVVQFHIKIRIKSKDKKCYYIKSILQINSEQESNNLYQSLKDLLFQLYNIEVITPFISVRS